MEKRDARRAEFSPFYLYYSSINTAAVVLGALAFVLAGVQALGVVCGMAIVSFFFYPLFKKRLTH